MTNPAWDHRKSGIPAPKKIAAMRSRGSRLRAMLRVACDRTLTTFIVLRPTGGSVAVHNDDSIEASCCKQTITFTILRQPGYLRYGDFTRTIDEGPLIRHRAYYGDGTLS